MDVTNSVKCTTCKVDMRETIWSDIPTCRLSHHYCEVCGNMVSIYSITESREARTLENKMQNIFGHKESDMQEIHPMEEK